MDDSRHLTALSFPAKDAIIPVMKYPKVVKAQFISRPNRFIAYVDMEGREEKVHVKNTGRCKELLIPGCTVYLEESSNPNRKTKYDLIAVEKELGARGGKGADKNLLLINMDSQAPNKVAEEWIKGNRKRFFNITFLKAEYSLGDSRFDFYLEYDDEKGQSHKKLIEVKGCTLERDGIALFPDAPTLRGQKHVRELSRFQKEGSCEAMILIIVQMKGCKYFIPNQDTDPDFSQALRDAKKSGVEILALDCQVKPDSLLADEEIEVRLDS